MYRKRVKMSRSFDRLAALIWTELNKEIINGDIFIGLNRNRTMIKVVVDEQKNFSMFYWRLDEGSFRLLDIVGDEVSYRMNTEQIMYMLRGTSLEKGGYVEADKYEPLLGSSMWILICVNNQSDILFSLNVCWVVYK